MMRLLSLIMAASLVTAEDSITFGGLHTHKPGLKLRITQAVSDLVKENLLQYGIAYMNFDLKIPESGEYKISSFPLYTDVHYWNLRYDVFQIDIHKAALNYTAMVIDDAPVVYLSLPVVEHWRVGFDYFFQYMFDYEGRFDFDFRNMFALVTTTLKATSDGHLFPQLHDLKIDISKAELFHSDWFAEFMYRQLFDLAKYTVMNAYNTFGADIINHNLYAITKYITNE